MSGTQETLNRGRLSRRALPSWSSGRATSAAGKVRGPRAETADRWLLLKLDRRLLDVRQPLPLILPLLLLLLATLLLRATTLDLTVSSWFHTGGPGMPGGFHLADAPLLEWLYWWGLLPTWLIATSAAAALIVGLAHADRRHWARAGTFLLLALALGPGLMVNAVYKDHWNRPRPDQVRHFGGDQEFRFVLERGAESGYYSFPSGHAAAGFYLMTPAFLLYRRRPKLAASILLLGLAAGAIIGMGRIMQGRHFASDVLWSAAMVYFTTLGLEYARILWPRRSVRATPWRYGRAPDASSTAEPSPGAPHEPSTQPAEHREAA